MCYVPVFKDICKILQCFLNTSQLSYHGLTRLHERLRANQLAVFFRNNHFNTLFKHEDGALYLLVTDLGYLREGAVVWERLSGIDGDTAFYKVRLPRSESFRLTEQTNKCMVEVVCFQFG